MDPYKIYQLLRTDVLLNTSLDSYNTLISLNYKNKIIRKEMCLIVLNVYY